MDARIFRINYKSDFIITLESDAGWATPFCIKFWTDSPQRAFYVQYDGETYTHCAPVAGEPTKLSVQFDDHHLGIGDLKYQIAYHFTVADFPDDTEDEVLNQAAVIINEDGQQEQVMLDLNGETAPEIAFSLPAYANEQQRIANEEQRIANEEQRIAAEETRQRNEQQRINQETARVNEFATLKSQSQAATRNANDSATLANQKAQLAADKAALAQQKAEYAQQQGDYAKAQGETAQADHERAESDHGIAADDHTQAGNDHTRAESDHGIAADDHTQAGNDHTRAESDHTRAESDHAAVEVYVDSLGAFDISAYHATGGVLAKYADLTAALGTNGANIPDALRKGGMSVKFVLSSDNKYVQYRLMSATWSTKVANWQGVDDEPTAGSDNLVKSGGVAEEIGQLSQKVFSFQSRIEDVPNYNLSVHFGKIIGTNGGVFNSDTRSTFVVPLRGATHIKSVTGVGSIVRISNYTDMPNYVDSTGFVKAYENPTFPRDVPSNIKFVVIDFTTANLGNIMVELQNVTATLEKKVSDIDSRVKTLNIQPRNFAENAEVGKYYDTSKVIHNSAYWEALVMDVAQYQGKTITLGGVATVGQSAATFFELSDNTIKKIQASNLGDIVTSFIPDNAVKLYYSGNIANSPFINIDDQYIYGESYVTFDDLNNALASVAVESLNLTKRKSVVSFIFDDNNAADANFKQYCDDEGIKCGFAVITIPDRYIEYYNEGFDILAHGNLPQSWTEQSLRTLIENDLSAMNAAGIKCVGWVTPSSELPENLRPIVYDYFEYGYTIYRGADVQDAYMPKTLKSYGLWRSNLDTLSEANCKSIIDDAVLNNAMVCFYSHTSTTEAKFKSIVEYAKAHSQVLPPTTACRYFFARRHNED